MVGEDDELANMDLDDLDDRDAVPSDPEKGVAKPRIAASGLPPERVTEDIALERREACTLTFNVGNLVYDDVF